MPQPLSNTNGPGMEDIHHFWLKIEKAFDFISSPQNQTSFHLLKTALIIFSVLFILLIIYFLVQSRFFNTVILENAKSFLSPKQKKKTKEAKKWKNIEEDLAKSDIEEQWKVDLLEAYSLFGNILQILGFQGKTAEERIEKLTENEINNLNVLRQAIDFCQDIIKDPDFKIRKEEAQRVMESLRQALTDLGFF